MEQVNNVNHLYYIIFKSINEYILPRPYKYPSFAINKNNIRIQISSDI